MLNRAAPDTRDAVAALIPHAGASVLLDAVVSWSETEIVAIARSHLEAANPLRRAGRLDAVCGIEYGLQAAALHGALRGDGRSQPAGFLASVREVALSTAYLDEPRYGALRITARSRHAGPTGMIYDIAIATEAGEALLTGSATVVFPKASA